MFHTQQVGVRVCVCVARARYEYKNLKNTFNDFDLCFNFRCGFISYQFVFQTAREMQTQKMMEKIQCDVIIQITASSGSSQLLKNDNVQKEKKYHFFHKQKQRFSPLCVIDTIAATHSLNKREKKRANLYASIESITLIKYSQPTYSHLFDRQRTFKVKYNV